MKLALPKARTIRIALLLAGSGVLTSLLIGNEPEPGRPAAAAAKRTAGASANEPKSMPTLDLDGLGRPITVEIQDNLFYIPPPPAPPPAPPPRTATPAPQVAAPPPKPTAPPLPFKFLGRLIDRGTTVIFVSHNGLSLNLKQGDTAADLYRVERITPTEVVFTYEPLAERQVLHIGAVN